MNFEQKGLKSMSKVVEVNFKVLFWKKKPSSFALFFWELLIAFINEQKKFKYGILYQFLLII